MPKVSDCAKFAVEISKDEAPVPVLTVGLLFISMHLSCVHLATLKIHSISQTPPNFKQRASPEVVNNSLGSGSKKKERAATGSLGQLTLFKTKEQLIPLSRCNGN